MKVLTKYYSIIKLGLKTINSSFFIAAFIYLAYMLKFLNRAEVLYNKNAFSTEPKLYSDLKTNFNEYTENIQKWFRTQKDQLKKCTENPDNSDQTKCYFADSATTLPNYELDTKKQVPDWNSILNNNKEPDVLRCDDDLSVYKNIMIVIMTLQVLYALYSVFILKEYPLLRLVIIILNIILISIVLAMVSVVYKKYIKLDQTVSVNIYNETKTCIKTSTESQISELKRYVYVTIIFLSFQCIFLSVT